MIAGFQGKIAKDIWKHNESKLLPQELWIRAKALLTSMHAARTLDDLRIHGEPPDIQLRKLRSNRQGRWSITIRQPWCITFKFQEGEFSDVMVEICH